MSVAVRMPLPRRFTIAEYLSIERKAETKSEYSEGMILAMAGGLPDHSLVAHNIGGELLAKLKGGSCRAYNSDLRVSVSEGEAIYYPDVTVVCGELKLFGRYRDVIANPALVVEVLSRSTSGYDRLVKVPRYQRTPSMGDILLASQDKPRVEHLTKTVGTSKWKSTVHSGLAAIVELPRLGCSLPLADIYSNVEF